MTDTSDSSRVVLAFHERYWTDFDDGAAPPLARYLELWPDHQETIAREYLALVDGSTADVRATEGAVLGPFVIESELGRGGQGVVYKATDTRLGRTVALKVLTGLGPGAESQLQRFRREAEVAAKLEHPGICGIHDTGVDASVPWIAMRYVEGETLADRIATTRQAETADEPSSFLDLADEEEVAASPSADTTTTMSRPQLVALLQTFEKVARALHAAHDAGVLHRDIKPGNIMVASDSDPVILDFGLARHDDDDLPSLTQTGDLFGTPAYMSPEQIAGQRIRLDARSDVYSLAVSLYECLTLRRPYDAPTREGLYQAVMTKEPPDPRRINRSIPKDLKVVLECALEKDRDKRYASADAFADDLAAVRELRPIAARPIGVVGRTVRWAKRRPVRAAFAVALIIGIPLVSGLAGFIWAKLPDIRKQEQADIDQRVERALERGFFHLAHGIASEAVFSFGEALREEPGSAEAAVGVALVHLERYGDPDAALEAVEVAERRVESPAVLLSTKADILRRLGRLEDAEAAMARAPEPDSALSWFLEGSRVLATAEHELGPPQRSGFRELRPSEEHQASYAQARELLLRAVHACKHARRAYHLQLLHATIHVGDESAIAEHAEVLESLFPRSPMVLTWVGLALGTVGNTERALRVYRAVIACDPAAADVVYWNLALILEQKGLIDEAIDSLRVLLGRERSNALADAYMALEGMLARAGRPDEALAEIERGVSRFPRHALLHYTLGKRLAAQGQESVDAYAKAAQLDPQLAQAHCEVGIWLYGEGRADEAEKRFRQALAAEPDLAEAHYYRGRVLLDRDRPKEAIPFLARATRLHPHPDCHYKLIQAYLRSGRGEDASKALRKAAESLPTPDLRLSWLTGQMHSAREEWDAAISAYREAIELDDTFVEAHCDMGSALVRKGDPDAALVCYAKALELRPQLPNALCGRAGALLDKGEFEQAIAAYQEALVVDPRSIVARLNLAWAYERLGDPERIPELLRQILKIDPENGRAHWGLAVAFERKGDSENAAAAYRRAHELRASLPPDWPSTAVALEAAVLAWARTLRQDDKPDQAIKILDEHAKAFPAITSFKRVVNQLRDRR